ncbi:MAG: thiamine pyrophosphate-dependent enzyme [Pseudomonadota bacterium]
MEPLILMGDEAIAQAALDAGIRGAFAYPGTPSTEIFEYVESHRPADRPVFAQWSTNEKTAYEEALGVSFAGARAIVSMKHVGLNVAADAFMNSAITGANGGLVAIVADDPSMHSSQNEQDTRYFADFAHVPCLEPATQQEAYDMVYRALAFSEEVGLPVLVRIVTRLAHSRAPVIPQPPVGAPKKPLITDKSRYILLPVNARRHWAALMARQGEVQQAVWGLGLDKLTLRGRRLGVIAAGVAHNYVMENLDGAEHDLSVLKVGSYPLNRPLIERLFAHCDTVLVAEDGYPFIEKALTGLLGTPPKPVIGRLTGHLPRTGELNPTLLRRALGLEALPTATAPVAGLVGRPPALCKGCPHADTYRAINEVMAEHPEGRVLSDIGCYTLGALPPYSSIDSCVDMGASVGMAMGASIAGVFPALAVIGDGTFAHSGITPLIDAVRAKANMVLVILDNDITAMTGRQESALVGAPLDRLLEGAGVDPAHIRVVNPLPKNHAELVAVLREEIAYEGFSVVIPRRPCIQIRH